ncbi:MAG: hypothetical protein C7B45_02945 [Sulfobacillus acidophilus]|uniref:FAD-binding domain-containing protein n=1 Tax=Sulfobacillus acidophilus TaxID=53633 RepID=A0A2T2WMP5_9FIRM|nr:MAG: hypothetical protein C7B45_02945 [Sulfobacillus acidophilus]
MVPRVAIIGGGIAGLTLAKALDAHNLSAVVLEARRRHDLQGGAALAMAPNAMWVFRRLGLADRIVAAGSRIDRYLFIRADGRPLKTVDLSRISGKWKESSWAVPRSHILQTVAEAVPKDWIRWNHSINALHRTASGYTLYQESGPAISARVVVGADGAHSTVRQALWDLPDAQYQGFIALRGLVVFCLPKTHQHTVVQVWGGAGEFGYSPVGEELVYWYATMRWPRPPADPPAMDDIIRHFQRWTPPISNLIEATDPSELLIHPIFDRLQPFGVRPAVTLIGDAAHLMTPNTGQGACQAIVDAYVLARELYEHPEDAERALQIYRRIRLGSALAVGWRSRRLGQLIHWQRRGVGTLQTLVLRAVPTSLVTQAMRQVVGQPERLS